MRIIGIENVPVGSFPELMILIPTTPDRKQLLDRLTDELVKQIGSQNVLIAINEDNYERTTGAKRNELIDCAYDYQTNVIAFHDSDDMPGETYIQRGLEFADSGMDTAELWGDIYWNGKKGKPFRHYLGCTHAWEDNVQYHRPPNHLNFWKLDLIKDFKFQDKTFGEDMTWAMEIQNAGIVKTMYPISETIYNYFCGHPKHEI